MHDIIFKNMRALSDEDLESYAKEIGLDVDQWKKDFESEEVKGEVAADLEAGKKAGVRGTPTILINGRKHQGARNFKGFKAAVDAEIKKADALLEDGTKINDVYKALSSAKK